MIMSALRSKLLNEIYFTENKLLLKLYSFYTFQVKSQSKTDDFINEELNILFIHNPKVAGNTLKNVLKLNNKSSWHHTPTFLVPPKVWEKYYTIVAVRHPIDRLLSSYRYHSQTSYQGYYLKKYPFLHNLELQEYFKIFKHEPFAILPQVNYIKHQLSHSPIDYIIRFEHLIDDVKKLCLQLNLSFEILPHLNATKKPKSPNYLDNHSSFKEEVIDFYREDFESFGYDF